MTQENGDLSAHRPFGRLAIVALLVAVGVNSGCVYRRLIVRSDPPGARVLIDGQEVGYTPTGIPFTYYGTRRLTLVKPGFETHSELVTIPPPWYQYEPLDFISDNFLPEHVADRHEISWQLSPQTVVPLDQLQQRADSLRSESHMGQ
jgi:PEGA domain